MVTMMIMGWHKQQQQYYQHKHEHHHKRQQHYQQQLQQRQSGCGGIIINGLIFLTFINLQINTVMATITSSAKFYTIHWNSTNPIFRIDNTDNIIDVNRNNLKFDYDQVNLICPVYAPGTRDDEMEKYIIYNVSKDEYETCRITNPNPRIIAVCDKPYKLMYFTITFRPFTPQPGGLEFLPGHDYYFISTSTSDDLHRRIGGRCTSHNMKIVFKVWGESSSTSLSTTSTIQPPLSRWWSVTSPRITTIKTPIIVMTTIPTTTTTSSSSSIITTTLLSTTKTTKKSKTYNKHPNEVVKSEELTLGGSGGVGGNSSAIPNLIISCVVIIVTITIYR